MGFTIKEIDPDTNEVQTLVSGTIVTIGEGFQYEFDADKKCFRKKKDTAGEVSMVQTDLPAPSISLMGQEVYVIDEGAKYICTSDSVSPASDEDCFWVQL